MKIITDLKGVVGKTIESVVGYSEFDELCMKFTDNTYILLKDSELDCEDDLELKDRLGLGIISDEEYSEEVNRLDILEKLRRTGALQNRISILERSLECGSIELLKLYEKLTNKEEGGF